MKIFNQLTLSAADASKTQSGSPFDVTYLDTISAQAVITGNAISGTLKIQVSNDAPPATGVSSTPTNWNDLAGSAVTVSGSGVYWSSGINLCANWARIVYVATNGAASPTITVNTRAIGD